MRLSVIFLALLAFLSGCGGGSSSSIGNAASGDSPDKNKLTIGGTAAQMPAPGNGIWNYSVATDYFYGSQKLSPSLYSDITNYDPSHTAIKYVFPVFGNVQAGANGDFTGVLSSTACLIDTDHIQPVFSYYALPQVNDRLLTGIYPSSPIKANGPFSSNLGACIGGLDATNYYKNTVGIPYVVPVVEIPDFETFIGSPSSATAAAPPKTSPLPPSLGITQVLKIADAIAGVIKSDPNAYGVAFDNEPAINKATSPLLNQVPNCQGLYYEQLFYGEIASQLAASGKYLFLFDAPDSGNNLYQGNTTILDPSIVAPNPPKNCVFNTADFPPLTYGPLKNIVLQKALYDLGDTTNKPANGPISLADNNTYATSAINSYLNTPNGPPVSFVLPASATSTMWDSLQVYNLPGLKLALSQSSSLLPPTTINQAGACNQDAVNPSTINYKVLSQYLCTVPVTGTTTSTCLTSKSPSSLINSTISAYLNSTNCGGFSNLTSMQQYFNGEINLINKLSVAGKSQTYLGSSLYAWRISAMSDLSGVPSTYSLLGSPTSPYSVQLFPMNISTGIWNDFINWTKSFPQ